MLKEIYIYKTHTHTLYKTTDLQTKTKSSSFLSVLDADGTEGFKWSKTHFSNVIHAFIKLFQ